MNKMIRVLLILMLALAGATSASADVLIYQFRSVSKNIGEGVEFTSSTRGYLVWNLADDHFTWVESAVLSSGKRYRVFDGSPLIVTASGWRDRQFTTFSSADGGDGRYYQDYNRGLSTTLKLASGRTGYYPRTLKGLTRALVTSVGPRLTDTTRTFVYVAARTVAANDAGKTEGEVVTGLQAELEAGGYTDIESVAVSGQTSGSVSVITLFGGSGAVFNQVATSGQPLLPPLPPTPYTPPDSPTLMAVPGFPPLPSRR